jgi:hypothetical protein
MSSESKSSIRFPRRLTAVVFLTGLTVLTVLTALTGLTGLTADRMDTVNEVNNVRLQSSQHCHSSQHCPKPTPPHRRAACTAIPVVGLRGNLLYGTWTQSANPTRNSP